MEVPCNLDAEAAVIGAALVNPQSLKYLTDLTVEDFYDPLHRKIWEGVSHLLHKGKIPDPLLVHEVVPEVSIADLAQKMSFACIVPSIPSYVEILRQKEHGRRLYIAGRDLLAGLKDGIPYSELEAGLITMLAKRTANEGTTRLDEACDIDTFLNGEGQQPYATWGLDELDLATGGIRGGEVSILAARTSIGKSALAVLSTIANAQQSEWNPLYISIEMSKRQLWNRFLSYQSRVNLKKFRDQYFTMDERTAIKAAEQELRPVMHKVSVNTEANTPGKIRQLVKMLQMEGRANYVIIDHAGRMQLDGRDKGAYEKMSGVINEIKDVALTLDVPVLLLWQLKRKPNNEDSPPTLEDLRDTGQAEEIADAVVLLNRSRTEENPITTIDVAKARDGGQLGVIKLPWRRITTRQDIDTPLGVEVPYMDF
jgi:replicative DNA helicase